MRQTLVGVFDRYEAARQAATRLQESGFGPDAVQLTEASSSGADTTASSGANPNTPVGEQDVGVAQSIRNFFSGIFGNDDEHEHVGQYAEAVRRGSTIVRVDVEDEDRLDAARDVLEDAGAVDIEEKAAEWRQTGWSPSSGGISASSFGSSAAASPALGTDATMTGGVLGVDADRDSSMTSGNKLTGQTTQNMGLDKDTDLRGATPTTAATGEQVLSVVREDIAVGKRTVNTGRVRVFSHLVERQVSEDVQLRDERAVIERRPVDRPATEADLNALTDRTIELQETTERPVVEKTARVVEEVVVGTRSEQRTETVNATLRDTEVDVERSADTDTDVGTRTLHGSGSASQSGGSTLRPFNDYDADFRTHFQSTYGDSGGSYDEFEPAYRYGHSMAGDGRYADRDWSSVESDARGDFEQRHPGSTWERVKGAVRRGWERATS